MPNNAGKKARKTPFRPPQADSRRTLARQPANRRRNEPADVEADGFSSRRSDSRSTPRSTSRSTPRSTPRPDPRAASASGASFNTQRPATGRRARNRVATPDKPERLQKLLAQSGFGSRREMEELIAAGRVTINGETAHLGQSAQPGDRVKINGRLVNLRFAGRLPRVILYHKPEGEIVSRDDPDRRPSVFTALPRLSGARWVAVGRLDFNTSGLLLFTTSGELANRLMHPRYEFIREYAVRVLGDLSAEAQKRLLDGIELEDGLARFASLQEDGGEGANRWYRVALSEGRNREVRRMFEAVGVTVSRLMRVRYGPFILPPRLKRGRVEELDEQTVRRLMTDLGMAKESISDRPSRKRRTGA